MKKLKVTLFVFMTIALSFYSVTSFGDSKIITSKKVLFNELYLGHDSLKTNIVIYKSDYDLEKADFITSCNALSGYNWKRWNLHVFNIKFEDKCKNPNAKLSIKWRDIPWSKVYFTVKNDYDLIKYYTDFSNEDLFKKINSSSKKLLSISWKTSKDPLVKAILKRQKLEVLYKKALFEKINDARTQKYAIPVEWYKMPTNPSRVPNTWRPYRAGYTDWIHHWWDIYAKTWTPVIAIDDWVIIRVISDFEFEDLGQINKNNPTYDEKFHNLDTLRWNQVWLKTMKWDVIFYSHLDSIPNNIKKWAIVKKWQEVWAIWISGVPERWYKDIHLHFTLHKNPYNKWMYWVYTYLDIMKWDWYFKWESVSEVIRKQYDIFNEK